MQGADGSFVNVYQEESDILPDFESVYYSGEAALGLLELYKTDHSRAWLSAAVKALSYLAESRARLPEAPPDQWTVIAIAELLRCCSESDPGTSREQLIRPAEKICRALMDGQMRNPEREGLDGSFDAIGRTPQTATRMEGLLAALEFLPKGSLREEAQDAVSRGIAFLLRAQIHQGRFEGGVPGAFSSTARGASNIRIDSVQHTVCAFLRYQSYSVGTEARARQPR